MALPAVITDPHSPQVLSIRGRSVVLDSDVARLFGIETRRLNEQVRRNQARFGEDFVFQLTRAELEVLMSQNATSTSGHGGRRKPPWAFSEHGVVMAATLLRSDKAIAASRYIVHKFVEARRAEIANPPGTALVRSASALAVGSGGEFAAKVQRAIDGVLDTMINPRDGTTLRDEAEDVLAEGLGHIKALLKRPGITNEKTVAEIAKLLAETETEKATGAVRRAEAEMKHLALTAKRLRLVLAAQAHADGGSIEDMLQVLKDLGDA